jgi:hypothetical protein
MLDLPLCRLTQITSAISYRRDTEFEIRARLVEWHARVVGMAAAQSEEMAQELARLSFFPDEDDDIPRDATGAPEAVRVGGGAVIPEEGRTPPQEAPEPVQPRFAPDPEPVKVGAPRIITEAEAAAQGVRVADAEAVEQIFGLPSLAVLVRPDNQEGP